MNSLLPAINNSLETVRIKQEFNIKGLIPLSIDRLAVNDGYLIYVIKAEDVKFIRSCYPKDTSGNFTLISVVGEDVKNIGSTSVVGTETHYNLIKDWYVTYLMSLNKLEGSIL